MHFAVVISGQIDAGLHLDDRALKPTRLNLPPRARGALNSRHDRVAIRFRNANLYITELHSFFSFFACPFPLSGSDFIRKEKKITIESLICCVGDAEGIGFEWKSDMFNQEQRGGFDKAAEADLFDHV